MLSSCLIRHFLGHKGTLCYRIISSFPLSQSIGLSSFYYLPGLYQKMRVESCQRLFLIKYFLPMMELLQQNEWLPTVGEKCIQELRTTTVCITKQGFSYNKGLTTII